MELCTSDIMLSFAMHKVHLAYLTLDGVLAVFVLLLHVFLSDHILSTSMVVLLVQILRPIATQRVLFLCRVKGSSL